MNISIGHLYPEQLNLYGDRGNIECLKQRCLWRNIDVEIIPLNINEEIKGDLQDLVDILFMGGGEDNSQKEIYNDFISNKGKVVSRYIEQNNVGLFICGGYQLLGKYYKTYSGQNIKGISLIDLHTLHYGRDKKRCVGNVVCKIENIKSLKSKYLVGFENHGGRTILGYGTKPIGNIEIGYGNNDDDKTEGVVYKNCIGSYLHGPLLPKNPHLADFIISKALKQKYKKEVEIETLDDELEWKAHKYAKKLSH